MLVRGAQRRTKNQGQRKRRLKEGWARNFGNDEGAHALSHTGETPRNSYTCPSQGTVNIIEKCGAFSYVAKPGCHFLNCLTGDSVAGTVSLRTQMLTVACETKTQDSVFVVLRRLESQCL